MGMKWTARGLINAVDIFSDTAEYSNGHLTQLNWFGEAA